MERVLSTGKIKIETAYKVIELISGIFNVLNLHSVKGFEKEVIDIAVREGVTFCDASYMYIALRNKLTLVTDDRKLMSVARKYVNVVTTSEIAT
ncbi:MAG: type II toxin-antitoxin system VapC family toxin [Candidatus Aenigmatarchaeota archaeon]